MFNQYVQQVKSADPEQRRQAIMQLANDNDERVPKILRYIAEKDPVPELRKLAEQAERHVERRKWRTIEQPITPLPPAPKPDSQLDDNSQIQLNLIYSKRNAGDRAGALTDLLYLLKSQPRLEQNTEIKELAAQLSGKSTEEAIPSLWEDVKKRQQQSKSVAPNQLNATLLNILIEVLIIFVLTAAFNIVGLNIYQRNPELMATRGASAAQTARIQRLVDDVQKNGVVPTALESAVIGVVVTLFVVGMMFVGGIFLGGTGNIFTFTDLVMRVDVAYTVGSLVAIILLLATSNAAPAVRVGMSNFVLFVLGIGSISSLFVFGYFAGKGHEFGIFRGLITVISPIVMACGCICLGAFLSVR